jgi:type IV pilus assembly protein PilA
MVKHKHGFTLIEVIIVVAIIAILAAIAIPAFQNYSIRAQATSGLSEISGGRSNFESLIVARGLTTFDVNDIGLQTTTERCSPIEMSPGADGFIRCTLSGHPSINGVTITLQRDSQDEWECVAPGLDTRHRPEGCR